MKFLRPFIDVLCHCKSSDSRSLSLKNNLSLSIDPRWTPKRPIKLPLTFRRPDLTGLDGVFLLRVTCIFDRNLFWRPPCESKRRFPLLFFDVQITVPSHSYQHHLHSKSNGNSNNPRLCMFFCSSISKYWCLRTYGYIVQNKVLYAPLAEIDPEVQNIIDKETWRQFSGLELIASEVRVAFGVSEAIDVDRTTLRSELDKSCHHGGQWLHPHEQVLGGSPQRPLLRW